MSGGLGVRFSALAEWAAQNRPGAASVRPPEHMGAGSPGVHIRANSRRRVGTCWRPRHANPVLLECRQRRCTCGDARRRLRHGVSLAAEAISVSEDALMLDSETAAIMTSRSSGGGSNECLPPPVDRAPWFFQSTFHEHDQHAHVSCLFIMLYALLLRGDRTGVRSFQRLLHDVYKMP